MRVVIAEDYGNIADRFGQVADVTRLTTWDEAALIAAVKDADALLVRSNARVTARVLDAGPRLKVVGRGGAGLDNIDVEAAKQRGITVVHTPAAATRSVAEHAIALLLALQRHLIAGDGAVRAGRFAAMRRTLRFRELGGLTLGVVGMGRIGSTVARMAHAGFGMRVIYNDIRPVGPFSYADAVTDKRALFCRSDVVTLHVPLTSSTRGMIDKERLDQFRPDALLINTSRGAVVELDALAVSLNERRLGGAGLDVFDPEPPPADHPILACPFVVMSPHSAARSGEAMARMDDVVDDVIRVLRGAAPLGPV